MGYITVIADDEHADSSRQIALRPFLIDHRDEFIEHAFFGPADVCQRIPHDLFHPDTGSAS
jgi:hypothetical protein